MSVFDVLVVPAILLGLFLAGLLWLAFWGTSKWVQASLARKASFEAALKRNSGEFLRMQTLAFQLADAINAVIAEVAAHPSVVLSDDVQKQLIAAHEEAAFLENGNR